MCKKFNAKRKEKVDVVKNLALVDKMETVRANAIKEVETLAEKYGMRWVDEVERLIGYFNCYFVSSSWAEDREEEEAKMIINEKIENIEAHLELCKKRINEFKDNFDKNNEVIEKLYNQGMPLFIVITDTVSDKNPMYCFCYEFKKTEKYGLYDSFIVSNESKNPYRFKLWAGRYSVKPMTEEEFENNYIIPRLEAYNPINEVDLVDYDNQLRQYFHGQREII